MVTNVLVTGGTGALGTELVPLLVTAGLHVRVLSRRRAPAVPAGAQAVRGDLTTGDGLDEAVTAIDVIAHLASETSGIPSYAKAQRTDVEGTGRLLDSARRAGVEPHVVYISIVGVDKIPFGYYRGKLATEQVIERSGLPYTILRTTQWHTLAAKFCLAARLPAARGHPQGRAPSAPRRRRGRATHGQPCPRSAVAACPRDGRTRGALIRRDRAEILQSRWQAPRRLRGAAPRQGGQGVRRRLQPRARPLRRAHHVGRLPRPPHLKTPTSTAGGMVACNPRDRGAAATSTA